MEGVAVEREKMTLSVLCVHFSGKERVAECLPVKVGTRCLERKLYQESILYRSPISEESGKRRNKRELLRVCE